MSSPRSAPPRPRRGRDLADLADLADLDADEEDPTKTSASHASHFLMRTLRYDGEDLERAIRLYQHPDVVRRLTPELLRDRPEAARAAIPLREPGPCVIVGRGGGFVTCLGAGMATDLPRLPYAAFAAAMDRADQQEERARRRVRQLRDLPVKRLTGALLDGYGHVTREMVQIILVDPQTYVLPVCRVCMICMRSWGKSLLTGRVARLTPELFVQQHRMEAAVRQGMILLGAMEDELSAAMLKRLLDYDSTLELEIVTSLVRWARGGDMLIDAALSEATGDRARKLAAIYVNMHCLYRPDNAPAMLRRLREVPARAGADTYWTGTRRVHDALLAQADERIVEWYRGHQIVARDFRPSTPHWQTTDNDLFDALTLYFPLTALFPPQEAATAAQRAWARYLRELPEPRDPKSLTPTVVRAGPRIGRNDPCPCQSGRKHKHCCLGKPAAPAPDLEPAPGPAPTPEAEAAAPA